MLKYCAHNGSKFFLVFALTGQAVKIKKKILEDRESQEAGFIGKEKHVITEVGL